MVCRTDDLSLLRKFNTRAIPIFNLNIGLQLAVLKSHSVMLGDEVLPSNNYQHFCSAFRFLTLMVAIKHYIHSPTYFHVWLVKKILMIC